MHEIYIGKSKLSLDTPCLVIDKKLLLENIHKMQTDVNQANKKLRPHVKTHKCIEICRLQLEAGAIGIAAAKVSEAMILAKHGIYNTLITSPIVTQEKIVNLLDCSELDNNLTIVIDNLENAEAINNAFKQCNKHINILIDIDPGQGRTGVMYGNVLEFAKALQQFKQLKLTGLQCYAGNLQHITDYNERYVVSRKEMQSAALELKQLQEAGFECHILSGAGTGTYDIDMQISGVTEVQPGSYTVMDTEYLNIGTIENPHVNVKYKPALTLLTSIVSVNHGSHVTCDAGWKALYEAPTKPLVLKPKGFLYDWFGDEHGKISTIDNEALPTLGDKLEILTGHCDPTINMYDFFYVAEDDIIIDVWPIEMRGKSQ